MEEEPLKFIVAPHRNLQSDENIEPAISPDGGNHFGRRQLAEMGQRWWYSAIFQPGNPMVRKQIINEDTTFTISTTGFFTDRINGKFDSWANFLEFFKEVELVDDPSITVVVEDGTYNESITIPNHPNFSEENFTLRGENRGATPTIDSDSATTLASLESYLPTKFTGSLTINKNVTVQQLLIAPDSGTALSFGSDSTKMRYIGIHGTDATGVQVTGTYFKPVSNFYCVHNGTYGLRSTSGKTSLVLEPMCFSITALTITLPLQLEPFTLATSLVLYNPPGQWSKLYWRAIY